jgi:arabinose-5-phosphate isomerase
VQIALGDALAVTLLDARQFGPEDFALSHPVAAWGVACWSMSKT